MTANRYRPWQPHEDAVIRTFAGIESGKEIAVRLGRTYGGTIERARAIGVSLQRVGELHHAAKYSDAQIERCRALRDEGMPIQRIADETGVKFHHVSRVVSYMGRNVRSRGGSY